MSYTRAQKTSSWTPPQGAKASHWAPPPITVQTKPASASSENQEMPSYKPLPADWATNNPIMRGLLERESFQAQGEVTHSDSSVEGNVQMSAEHGTIQRQCQECESELSAQEEKPPIQAKLTVGAPGDPYEQEADRVAAQVMSMSVAPDNSPQVQRFAEENNPVQTRSLAQSITPVVQRRVNDQVQLRELVQQAFQASRPQASGDLEGRLNASKGGGSPLTPEVRSFMEPRFGADFSAVRVHTGGEAVQMNRELGAQAFTHGSDVYFGAGKSPGNNELTAHELTHVMQQSSSINSPIQRECGVDESCMEEPNASYAPEEPNASYAPEEPNASYAPEEPNASYAPEEPNASYAPEEPNASYAPEEPNAPYQESETSDDTESVPPTEQQALERMRQDIALAEELLEDPNLSEEQKASLRRAIQGARGAVENYQDIRAQGSTRTDAMGGIGLAAAGIVADDATGVGVADDPLLIFLALAAIATLIATRPPASQDAVAEAWLNVGRNLRGLADTIETVVLMTAAGNVIHDHIVDEATELAIALGHAATAGEVTREVLCQMLERMARQYRRSDTDKWKKIISTQKGLGCRGSRASR